MNKKIVISGWYGFGNIGDEAILQAMIDTFEKEYPNCNITVLSYNPEYTKRVQRVDAVYQIPIGKKSLLKNIISLRWIATLKAIKNCDIFIMGGGGFLSDWQPEVPKGWLKQMKLAKFFGKKTMLYGIGAGPFLTDRGKKTTKYYIDNFVDKITVRDMESYRQLVENVGVFSNKVTLASDPVISISKNKKINIKTKNKKVVYINFFKIYYNELWENYEEKYKNFIKEIDNLIEYLIVNGYTVKFLSVFNGFDENILVDLKSNLEVIFIEDISDLDRIKNDIEFIIAMRFHLFLISFLKEINTLPVIYHHKIGEKVNNFGIKEFLEVGDGTNWKNSNLKISVLEKYIEGLKNSIFSDISKEIELEHNNIKVLRKLLK